MSNSRTICVLVLLLSFQSYVFSEDVEVTGKIVTANNSAIDNKDGRLKIDIFNSDKSVNITFNAKEDGTFAVNVPREKGPYSIRATRGDEFGRIEGLPVQEIPIPRPLNIEKPSVYIALTQKTAYSYNSVARENTVRVNASGEVCCESGVVQYEARHRGSLCRRLFSRCR